MKSRRFKDVLVSLGVSVAAASVSQAASCHDNEVNNYPGKYGFEQPSCLFTKLDQNPSDDGSNSSCSNGVCW